ncbi:hypothetical protein KAW65_00250 [candidate division WOR-3 bacterium]|nr:hypothetical protein [candidate division WOR-3 bacterium]
MKLPKSLITKLKKKISLSQYDIYILSQHKAEDERLYWKIRFIDLKNKVLKQRGKLL